MELLNIYQFILLLLIMFLLGLIFGMLKSDKENERIIKSGKEIKIKDTYYVCSPVAEMKKVRVEK